MSSNDARTAEIGSAARRYGSAFNNATGEQEQLLLDAYLPPAGEGAAMPVAVLVHGGSFDAGDKSELTPLALMLATRGFAVVSINYRRLPGAGNKLEA